MAKVNTRFLVLSHYTDGDTIIEGVYDTRDEAITAADRVEQFRQDQDEAPRVTVEQE